MKTLRLIATGCCTAVVLIAGIGSAEAVLRSVPTATYPTVQDAVDVAIPGDTIQLLAGVHQENDIDVDVNRLTFIGSCGNPASTVIDGTGPSAGIGEDDIFVVDADDITFRCMTLRNGDTAIDVESSADGLKVIGVRFEHNDSDSIDIDDADDYEIRSNWFYNPGGDAVEAEGDDGKLTQNVVRNADDECFDLDGDDIEVSWNDFRNCEDGTGVYYDGDGAVITDNRIDTMDNNGVYVDGDDSLVRRNEIINIGAIAIEVDGDDNVVDDNDVKFAGNGDVAICVDGDDNRITNNTVFGTTGDYPCYDLSGDEMYVSRNTADGCGEGGFEIDGDAPVVLDNRATNAGEDAAFEIDCDADCDQSQILRNYASGATSDEGGFDICASDAGITINYNTAENNSEYGFELDVDDAFIRYNRALGNGTEQEEGFYIGGNDNTITNNLARENGGAGFGIHGDRNHLGSNQALTNYGDGFEIDSNGHNDNVLDRNISRFNSGEGIDNDRGTGTVLTFNFSSQNHLDCTNDAAAGGTIATDTGNSCQDGSNFTLPGEVD